MHSAYEYAYACIWHCILVKVVWFFICNVPLMIIIVVYDDCLNRDNRDMAENVDDAIACDQHYYEEKLEQ